MALEIFRLVGSIFVDTDQADKSLKKTDKNAEGFGSKLLNVGKKAGKFALGVAGAAAAAGTAIVALTESTREYRTEQGKLQTAFEMQNFTAEAARKTYVELNGVLGDSGQAVEAANHLAQLCDTEEDLAKWTNIATGVYATFGDSIPIEGLTEAANETAKTGAVTGGLADALNWASQEGLDFNLSLKHGAKFTEKSAKELSKMTKSQRKEYEERKKQHKEIEAYNKRVQEATSLEDKFNIALEECSTEQERQALITSVMNDLYSDSAEKYKELNADVIAANEAQDRLNNSMAAVGGAMEPFVTKGKELIAEVMERLVPVLEYTANVVLPWVSNAFQVVSQWVQDLLGGLGESGITFDSVMAWIREAFSGAMTFIKQYWEAYGQPVWNFIKQAVQLVADYFKERMPQIKEFVKNTFTDIKNLWTNNLQPALKAIGDFIENVLAPTFKFVFENIIAPIADNVFSGIADLWTKTLKPILEGMIDFIGGVFSGDFSKAWKGVLKQFKGVWEGIKTIVKAPINGSIRLINKFIEKINGVKIPDWVPGMGGDGVFNMKTIPLLASGGVLEQGQVGLLEGSGAEAVVPLHNNKKWVNAVANDMNGALGGGQAVALLQDVRSLLEQLVGAGIYLDTGVMVGALAKPMDKKLGQIQAAKARA